MHVHYLLAKQYDLNKQHYFNIVILHQHDTLEIVCQQ